MTKVKDPITEELEAILTNPKHHVIIQLNSQDQREFIIDNETYHQIELLGNTKNSHTYLVEGPTGKAVLKSLNFRLPKDLSPTEKVKQIELFEREASILSKLHHPQIPTLQKYFEAQVLGDTTFYILEEYIPAHSLEQMISQNHKIPPKQAAEIILSILNPLEYCHSLPHPILHRDIKPSNILVEKNNIAKLVDFGNAIDHKISSLGGSTIAGTVGYMAPEQWLGQASKQSDIYGLGTTLLEMLTGIKPAEMLNQNAATFEERFQLNYKPYLKEVDPNLKNIIDKCLKLNPQQRYPSIAHLKTDLENYLAGKYNIEKPKKKRQYITPIKLYWTITGTSIALAGAALIHYSISEKTKTITAEYSPTYLNSPYLITSTLEYEVQDETQTLNSEITRCGQGISEPTCTKKVHPAELKGVLEETLQSTTIFEYRQNTNSQIYEMDTPKTKKSILEQMKHDFKNEPNIEFIEVNVTIEKKD